MDSVLLIANKFSFFKDFHGIKFVFVWTFGDFLNKKYLQE